MVVLHFHIAKLGRLPRMAALGVVRVTYDCLTFSTRRQINFNARERLARVLQDLSKTSTFAIHIPCAVGESALQLILKNLECSADELRGTLKKGQKNLPLLTGIKLPCLYGQSLATAAKRNDDTSIVIHLFSAERKLRHPSKLA
jgi:hypothetical protein